MKKYAAYIVLCQIGMIGLDAVVKDGDDHAFAGVAFGPRRDDIHVKPFQTPSMLHHNDKQTFFNQYLIGSDSS